MNNQKLTMDELERKRFQTLPLKLRQRIAALLKQPELIPPDGRKLRSEKLRTERQYEVKLASGSKRLCTLEEAHTFVTASLEELTEFFARKPSRYERARVFTEADRFGETTITHVGPKAAP